jgi:hypothetical protein
METVNVKKVSYQTRSIFKTEHSFTKNPVDKLNPSISIKNVILEQKLTHSRDSGDAN